jgi:hypothetical protein
MSVRPIFWLLLAISCVGVLLIATMTPISIPAVMQVHLEKPHPASTELTRVELHLTDTEGLPLENAEVVGSAYMTNMQMAAGQSSVSSLGHGSYAIRFWLSMTGPWAITVQATAPGFQRLSQTLLVQVE